MENQQVIEWIRSHYFGKYRGVAMDNNDPSSLGRIKVKVPDITGELDCWAMPCFPYTGNQVGIYAIPEIGTRVWVEFEAGNPAFPIWTGVFFTENQKP